MDTSNPERRRSRAGVAVAGPAMVLAVWLAGGCEMEWRRPAPPDPAELRQAAADVLAQVLEADLPQADASLTPRTHGVNSSDPLHPRQLKVMALETIGQFPGIVRSDWIGQSLRSPSDVVRYAALLTVGRLADYDNGRLSKPHLGRARELLNSNDFLEIASAYALYRLTGQTDAVSRLPRLLQMRGATPDDERALAAVRSETAFVLSLMPKLGPKPLLQKALKDPSESVQLTARERLAVLGDKDAIEQVINMLQSPHPDDQADALQALAEAPIEDLDPIRRCLEEDRQEEVRMAAARTLGLRGDRSGLKIALKYINFKEPDKLRPQDIQRDPYYEQRVRWLAALALGAIGEYDRSARPLLGAVRSEGDRRLQVTAARAALELLVRSRRWDGVTASGPGPGGPT